MNDNKKCPVCGSSLDIGNHVPGSQQIQDHPRTGDITLCVHCESILIVNRALNWVVPEAEELYYIKQDASVQYAMARIRDAAKHKRSLN